MHPQPIKVNTVDLNFFVVNGSLAGATVIQNDTWYYTRVKFNETDALSVTSTNNYDDAGGAVISSAILIRLNYLLVNLLRPW